MACAHRFRNIVTRSLQLGSGLQFAKIHSLKATVRTYRTSAVALKRGGRSVLDARPSDHEEKERQMERLQSKVFDEAGKKAMNKNTFQQAIKTYMKKQEVYRRGSVEFIYAAMTYMEQFGVHKDLDTYKRLLNIFPRQVMIAKTVWQAEFQHFPKHQQCIIDLLQKMEDNGLIPDDELGDMLRETFGDSTHVFRKYQRMMYWMPKFRNANPYPIPYELPDEMLELAKLALKRMAVDLQNELTVYKASELKAAADNTWIVSAISPKQIELISQLDKEKAVFVEGAFKTWMRHKSLNYFILKSETTEAWKRYASTENEPPEDKPETWFAWDPFFTDEKPPSALVEKPSVHEQEDGTILGMCITGTGSEDSLRSWISFLQRTNPRLSQTPVVFSLIHQEAGLEEYEDPQKKHENKETSNSADSDRQAREGTG